MPNKATRTHLKQTCAMASVAVLRKEMYSHAGIYHKSIRKIVYAELHARKHGRHAS